MSIAVALKIPEGLVLAADSRLTFIQPKAGSIPDLCFMDASTKLWALGPPNPSVAVAFCGTAQVGVRSVGDLIAEFQREQGQRKPVETLARELHAWLGPKGLGNVTLLLVGFDESAYFGRMFELRVPGEVKELHPAGSYGVTLAGKTELATRVLETIKPPLELLPLKAAGELARWLIDLTTTAQGYSLGLPSVGGVAQIVLSERGKGARLV